MKPMKSPTTTTPSTSASDDVRAKHAEYLCPAVANYYDEPAVMTQGRGHRLTDLDGREYLDFFGGILTVSIGHADERVNAAVHAQIDRLSHVSTLYPTLPMVELAERLARVTPGALKQSFFTASGSEADETAVMLAQLFTERSKIVALRHGYSGRSIADGSCAVASAAEPGGRDHARARALLLSVPVEADLPLV